MSAISRPRFCIGFGDMVLIDIKLSIWVRQLCSERTRAGTDRDKAILVSPYSSSSSQA